MKLSTTKRRVVAVTALGIGLLVTPAAAFASQGATTSASPSVTTVAPPTTAKAPPTTAKAPPTTAKAPPTTAKAPPTTAATTKPAVTKFAVVAGSFKTQKAADAQLKAITAKQIKGFAVVTKNKKFLVEAISLSKTDAKTLVKALKAAKFKAETIAM